MLCSQKHDAPSAIAVVFTFFIQVQASKNFSLYFGTISSYQATNDVTRAVTFPERNRCDYLRVTDTDHHIFGPLAGILDLCTVSEGTSSTRTCLAAHLTALSSFSRAFTAERGRIAARLRTTTSAPGCTITSLGIANSTIGCH